MKTYIVKIEKICPSHIEVSAKNQREAKKKAWAKYQKKEPKKYLHTIYVDQA